MIFWYSLCSAKLTWAHICINMAAKNTLQTPCQWHAIHYEAHTAIVLRWGCLTPPSMLISGDMGLETHKPTQLFNLAVPATRPPHNQLSARGSCWAINSVNTLAASARKCERPSQHTFDPDEAWMWVTGRIRTNSPQVALHHQGHTDTVSSK